MTVLMEYWKPIAHSAGILAGGILVGLAVAYTLLFILRYLERGAFRFLFSTMRGKVRSPLRVLVPLIALAMILPVTDLSESAVSVIQQVLEVLIILNVAWLFIKLVHLVQDLILSRFELEARDNLLARKVYT
ncbi:MAG: hypothetical protein ACOC8N_06675, partial [Spirochaetota bacterium]